MKLFLGVLILSFVLMSCGGYNETVTQKTEKGQIKFIGNVLQTSVSIDDGEMFVIDKIDLVYQLKPGKHNIKAYKNDQLVVNRDVILDGNVIMEIEIP